LAHKTPSYDTNILPEVQKIVIHKLKQNIDETDSKQQKSIEKSIEKPYKPMDFKNLKKNISEPKISRLLLIFVISSKKSICMGIGCRFKNL
jgi:hypothetical protein